MISSTYLMVKLEEICTLITDGTHHSPTSYEEGDFLYLTSKNIRPHGVDLSDISYVKKEVHDEIYRRCPVEFGDVLFVKDGANTGTAAVNTLTEPFSLLSSVALIKPDQSKVDAGFLKHWLVSPTFKQTMLRSMSGTAIRRIILREIKAAQIPLPPLPEQRRIAAILDQADAIRRKRQKAIELTEKFLKSAFLEMFGDPVTNPNNYDRVKLIDLAESPESIKCGPFGTQLLKSEFQKSGVPLWGIKQVNRHFKQKTHEFLTETKARELEAYTILPGDIVMTRKGTIGNCSVYPSDFPPGIMHSDLLRIRLDQSRSRPLVTALQLAFSRHVTHQISMLSQGAIMAGINVTKLKQIEVLSPPIDEQLAFERTVDQYEKTLARQRRLSSVNEQLFNSLVQRAFRGELSPVEVP
ncbi:restriction endonuclease subunit S [Bremerella sp.]|uniref:restriction endonuclease subunit S n=1 Tax=Bremerella sp. TaxID=2795602 RepID=UPI0039191308